MEACYKLKTGRTHLEMLPEEMLLTIFMYLSAVDGLRLGSVSKRWQERKRSCPKLITFDNDVPPKQPWYFIFKLDFPTSGCAYDPDMGSWRAYDFPWPKSYYISCKSHHVLGYAFSSSNGLVYIMKNTKCSDIFICNPILKCGRMLPELEIPSTMTAIRYSHYAPALLVDTNDKTYKVAMVGCINTVDRGKEINIYLYESKKNCWTKLYDEKMSGFADDQCSVIYNNVLYFVMDFSGVIGSEGNYHAVMLSYELFEPSIPVNSLMDTAIKPPCAFRFVSLINLTDKLVMVGTKTKFEDAEDTEEEILEEVGIFELCDNEWKEVARMPHTYVEDFQSTPYVINASGSGQFIYMHPYESTLIVIFDFNRKIWKRVDDDPIYLQPVLDSDMFRGFCFEPRLDILP